MGLMNDFEWCARRTLRFVDLPGKPRADWQLRAAKVAERCIGSEYWLDGAFARGPANGAHGAPYGLTTCPENRMGLGSPGIQPGRVRIAHAEWNFDSGISDRAGCLWGSSDWCARRTLLFAYLLGKPGRVRIAHAERFAHNALHVFAMAYWNR